MKKKDLVDLKNKNKTELKSKVADMRKVLVETGLELKLGRVKNVHEFNKKRKELAQTLTFLRTRELDEKSDKQDLVESKKGKTNGAN